MFELWHRVRDGTLTRCDFAELVQQIRSSIKATLLAADGYEITAQEKTPLAHTVRTCRQLQVEEHRFHQLMCEDCGCTTRVLLPDIVNSSGYGERVVAHVALLSSLYRQSQRMVQRLMQDLFGVVLSVSSGNQPRTEASAAVTDAVDNVQAYVQQQSVVGIDETAIRTVTIPYSVRGGYGSW